MFVKQAPPHKKCPSRHFPRCVLSNLQFWIRIVFILCQRLEKAGTFLNHLFKTKNKTSTSAWVGVVGKKKIYLPCLNNNKNRKRNRQNTWNNRFQDTEPQAVKASPPQEMRNKWKELCDFLTYCLWKLSRVRWREEHTSWSQMDSLNWGDDAGSLGNQGS